MELLARQLRWEAEGVLSLVLTDPSGGELEPWEPGAHLDLMLPNGMVRQYSLCGNPSDRSQYVVGVLRETNGRGGSVWIHDELRVGTTLEARGPKNHFRFNPTATLVFIAGGIGVTPIIPMIQQAQRERRDWHLWYGGRSRKAMAFVSQILAGAGVEANQRVHLFAVDEGSVIDLEAALAKPTADASVYCCGPEALLNAVQERCTTWPAGSLHYERFAAPPASTTAPPSPGAAGALDEFTVVARASGTEVVVAAGESILDVLESAGVNVAQSCREGICGSCEVKILEGTAEHRDLVLTDEERAAGDTMMICVSRSRTPRLVLDL